MKKFFSLIDTISIRVGEIMKWFALIMISLSAFEVIMRYVFNKPTYWGYETLIMLGASMYSLSWAYVHNQGGHIRVDVIYSYLPPKGKTIVEIVCTLVFFFPLLGMLTYISGARMWRAWEISEKSILTSWYPPLGPVRTAVFLGICLFTLQGIVQFIRLFQDSRGEKNDN